MSRADPSLQPALESKSLTDFDSRWSLCIMNHFHGTKSHNLQYQYVDGDTLRTEQLDSCHHLILHKPLNYSLVLMCSVTTDDLSGKLFNPISY